MCIQNGNWKFLENKCQLWKFCVAYANTGILTAFWKIPAKVAQMQTHSMVLTLHAEIKRVCAAVRKLYYSLWAANNGQAIKACDKQQDLGQRTGFSVRLPHSGSVAGEGAHRTPQGVANTGQGTTNSGLLAVLAAGSIWNHCPSLQNISADVIGSIVFAWEVMLDMPWIFKAVLRPKDESIEWLAAAASAASDAASSGGSWGGPHHPDWCDDSTPGSKLGS
jgi:hypothetical protein